MIEKRVLVPDRVRRPPREGFSWIDRRFLHEYAARLSGDAVFLYLFLAAVSDQHGLSFYRDSTIAVRLRIREPAVVAAREELLTYDLIRRLSEIEGLSKRAISRRLHCSQRTVKKALALAQPPDPTQRAVRGSILDPYKPKIQIILGKYPDLSAVRIMQEIAKPPEGYGGEISLLREYLRQVRPAHSRVYQEVDYEPGQARPVDWGSCGRVLIGQTQRQVSVFVAVLCYSRPSYIEFCLSQRKAEFYRALVHALTFFQGSPKQIIFDNLKAAVLNGHGRSACLHPEFLALCGHFCMEPIACARRDPESKACAACYTSFLS